MFSRNDYIERAEQTKREISLGIHTPEEIAWLIKMDINMFKKGNERFDPIRYRNYILSNR